MGTPRPPLAAGNPRIKQLRRLLGRRSARRDSGRCVVEGPTLVGEAVAGGLTVHEVFVDAVLLETSGLLDTSGRWEDPAWPWLAAVPADRLWPVAPGVLARVLDTEHPQPVAAVVDLPATEVAASVRAATPPFLVVLAGVSDPGNVGTIVRSASAAGASVLLTEGTADPFSPKTVRASAGAVLRTPLAHIAASDLIPTLRAAGVAVWVADAAEGQVPDQAPLAGSVALVIGNEAHGVPGELVAGATGRLHLPMVGATESLNAAMAASILVFEVARQRRGVGTDGRDGEGAA